MFFNSRKMPSNSCSFARNSSCVDRLVYRNSTLTNRGIGVNGWVYFWSAIHVCRLVHTWPPHLENMEISQTPCQGDDLVGGGKRSLLRHGLGLVLGRTAWPSDFA